MATPSDTPSPRSDPFIASEDDLAYLWGGNGDTESGKIFTYSAETKTWTGKRTKGECPPAGLHNGACCIANQQFYLYGGHDGTSRQGTLFQLNMEDWSWKELSNCSPEGPGKKSGCRMVAYKHNLVVVGGCYDGQPSSKQAGSSYDVIGRTNEVHSYSLATGQWSSPSMKGTSPPSCEDFSLTMIDKDQAVMFGGFTPSRWSSNAHVLNLKTMTWRRLQHQDGDPWPEARRCHIAACLGYGEEHKTVLISGGAGDRGRILNDLWLLHVESGRCEEVKEINRDTLERYHHGAAALSVSSECVKVVLLGGVTAMRDNLAVLRFDPPQEESSSQCMPSGKEPTSDCC